MALSAAVNALVDNLSNVNDLDADTCKDARNAHYGNFTQMVDALRCDLFDAEAETLVLALKTVAKKIMEFQTRPHDAEGSYYEHLQNEGVDLKKLTAFLWILIEKALVPDRTNDELEVGLCAANLYMCLVGVKDAKMYHVFHVYIFERAIELLKTVEKLLRPAGKVMATIGSRKRREEQNQVDLDINIGALMDVVIETLKALCLFTHSKGVADIVFEKEGLCENVIDFLRDIADFDMDGGTDFQAKLIEAISSVRRASDLSFAIIQNLLQKDSETRSTVIMAHYVTPRLLYWVGGNSKYHITGSIPNILKDACTVMVHFLGTRFDSLTLSELRAIMKMMQILPLKCTDRSEHRSLLARTYSEILAMMPPIASYHIIDFIYILGRNSRTANRSFALEIVPHLLQRFRFDHLHDRAERIETMFMGEANEETILEQEDDDEIVEGDAAEMEEDQEEAMAIVDDAEEEGEVMLRDEEDEAAAADETVNESRERRNDALCVFERQGMTARQAVLNLLITGLVDKFAMQKALQAVEVLVSSNACVDDLSILSTRLVEDNLEALKMTDRPPRTNQQRDNQPQRANQQHRTNQPVNQSDDQPEVSEAAPEAMIKEEPEEEGMELTMSAIMEAEPENPDINDLLRLVIRACDSEKTPIAKHALCCLQAILYSQNVDAEMTEKCVEKIREKCWDVAIQVRKQAAMCLHKLLPRFPSGIEHAWLRGVLHQVVDNESGVANQAIKMSSEYIVEGLKGDRPNPTWNLMDVVEGDTEYTRYLSICLTEQSPGSNRTTNVPDDFIRRLERVTESNDCPPSAWMLLAELSPFMDVKPQYAENVFDSIDFTNHEDRIPTYVAKIIANRSKKIPAVRREALKEKIGQKIKMNKIAVTHIGAVAYAFACLMDALGSNDGHNRNESGAKEMERFVKEFQVNAIRQLKKEILSPFAERVGSSLSLMSEVNSQRLDTLTEDKTDKVLRMIHCIGELLQYAPQAVDEDFVAALKVIVAGDEAANQFRQFRAASVMTNGTQGTMRESQAQVFRDFIAMIPLGIRSAAAFAIGRICILREEEASKYIQTLIQQLTMDKDHCLRNNILVTLADLCTTGGAAVNQFGPVLATAMRDKSVLVRRHAVSLITTLMRDEYFKWGGQIMYYYLGALVDPDERVRDQCNASLLNVLLPKFPNMFSNKFVESMFYLNDVIHPSMKVLIKQEQENCSLPIEDYFKLYGARNRKDRLKIYMFMISTFEDKIKVPLMGRIAMEVFQCLVDEALDPKDSKVQCLMADALDILRSKEMILSMNVGKKTATDDVDEESEEANAMAQMAKDVISNVYMYKICNDCLHYLFKARDYLKVNQFPEFARLTYSTILDIYVQYIEYFEQLCGSDAQRKEEVRNDLKRHRNINVPQPGAQGRRPQPQRQVQREASPGEETDE
ncbi:unnamed protein product [Bursaphelenchus okinawaensis]|uniref:Condensin complex subunit 1 C-terminal domain-containing protein n=1 Tax=Bursaphelenchus okinawaensis TaxID=465554 RepID=A0A811KCG3_9BILA|nr:unnamed protein product [Bursaphelenchus okinawaensis]CAG9096717.1 unnamed protein product [Bursaphelenchus okinawaensis]